MQRMDCMTYGNALQEVGPTIRLHTSCEGRGTTWAQIQGRRGQDQINRLEIPCAIARRTSQVALEHNRDNKPALSATGVQAGSSPAVQEKEKDGSAAAHSRRQRGQSYSGRGWSLRKRNNGWSR